MKNYKRIIISLLAAILMLAALSGCGKHGKCEQCGQDENLKEFIDSRGNSSWYCEDCYRMAKLFDS